MSEHSSYDAVKRFVDILEHRGLRKRLGLSDEDIADTLWLALQMGVENTTQIIKQLPETLTQPIPENPIIIEPTKPVEPSINLYTPSPPPLVEKSENEEKIEGLPFQAPAAPALPNKLQISRALRPLMRKVPSYYRRNLDVEATVNHIVEALIVKQEIWIPITKPQPERWLNLELVVEENRSSFIWQETINELNQILENYGIFQTVRNWNLSSDLQGNLQLVSRKKGKLKNHCQYNYRELYHSNGRGLILLVSDCVSTIWQAETIYQWLQKWSNQSPTAIMQLFPERLWLSSELGLGYKVKLSAFNPGVPNSKLICREDLDIEQVLNLPIITLEAESLKEWAKVVAGYGKIQTPAIVLDLDFIKEQIDKTEISQSSEASPEAIVDRFLATASPTAQRLAGLMAAVPVSLPVVHLIQKTMLPKSTPVNVAEVFLSGMIERKKNDSSEINEYDFVVGVRKLLNQAMRLAETERVLDVVSEYIAEKMGLSMKSFTALLLNMPYLSQEQQVNLLPFAHVRAEVLRNLGGKYAELAEQIEPNKLLISDDVPPVQELIFEVATITIELELEIQPFEFEVAIIELERKAPVIKRSRQQAQYFIEDLGNGVRLEMVSIPEGSFMMGAPRNEKDRNNSERPQHQVTVQPFFMGKYTVTQEQWKAVAALPRINRDLEADPSRFKGANRPVERVSWYDAVEFCDRVTRLVNEHRFSQHTGKSYRLPSEAEWEYTCRAGTTTPFHFGETITSELANYDANYTYGARVKRTYREETTVVGSFGVANNFGLYDMHGNVCEWCLDDWHSNYEGAPTDGSAWFDGNDNDNLHQKQGNAMLRGGSWSSVPISCRSASRDFNLRASRDFHDLNFGFRVVCAFGRIFQ